MLLTRLDGRKCWSYKLEERFQTYVFLHASDRLLDFYQILKAHSRTIQTPFDCWRSSFFPFSSSRKRHWFIFAGSNTFHYTPIDRE
ncbi:unnamed protein product [Lactuca virosa]|uniref:Uncharacterized protein n=1 Tax=Lactuca virosa TaxID=75947 RepID=A0AAU9MSP8_9ASTR|nr:unnamed protein product [Lactuca virosa]